jgi:response regulator RpfG family c-di-GMP phosphodiesterase
VRDKIVIISNRFDVGASAKEISPMASEDMHAVSQSVVEVLLISPFNEDHQHLRSILRHSNWRQHDASTQSEAFAYLRDHVTPVAICEGQLPDGTWRDVLDRLGGLRYPPFLVVTSRMADERLWSEVLNLGGYNVLAKPMNSKEVFHVAGLAWMAWQRKASGGETRFDTFSASACAPS